MTLFNFVKKGASAPFFIAAMVCSIHLQAQSLRQHIDKNKTILCAHRGGMYGDYSENSLRTLAFLEKTFGPNPVMAEVDIRKSKNGTLYLLHDNTLERTTTGTGKIEDRPDEYLESVKLRDGNGKATIESIPTLSQLLDFVAKRNILLMLDVKIDDWKSVLDMVKLKNAVDRCVVLTFKPENSKKVHDLSGDILVSCLVSDRADWEQIKTRVSQRSLMAYINKTTPADVVSEMKDLGIPLVTDASEMTRNNGQPFPVDHYKSIGVNVLVTDLPGEVHALLK